MFKLLLGLIGFAFCAYIISLVIAAVGFLFEVLFKYWWVLALCISIAVGVYLYTGGKKRKRTISTKKLDTFADKESLKNCKKQQTQKSLTTSMEDDKDLTITTNQQLQEFYDSHELLKSFITKVVGVSYPNDDGSSRQEILSSCLPGEPVWLSWHTFNGAPACAVMSDYGQIGYLKADLAADLHADYVAWDVNNIIVFSSTISDITGGEKGLSYGCNIRIDIYKDTDESADSPASEVPKPQPTPKLPVARLDPVPAAQPTKRRRPKPSVPEEEPTPEPPPEPHDWIRSHETLDHYIVLDIETTGFSKENDRIIELAAIHYVYGVESETFCTFIDPEREIPRHITALTGIRDSDVANAPLISSVKRDFLRFIQDYPLVGHNIKEFDLPFLSAQLDAVIPNITIDTLDLAREFFPEMPNHKLSDLNEWLHLHEGISHRAVEDVKATNELLWACLYPEKYQDVYQAGIRNGFPKPERSAKKVHKQRKESISTSQIYPNQNASPDSPLYGKRIVFTGELSISREQAMRLAAEQGAILRTVVSGKTDFLVVGQQDMAVVGAGGMSTKEEKAHLLNDLGKGHIQIIDETQFRELVGIVP